MKYNLLVLLIFLSFACVQSMEIPVKETHEITFFNDTKSIIFKYNNPDKFDFITCALKSGMKEAENKAIYFLELTDEELDCFANFLRIIDSSDLINPITKIYDSCIANEKLPEYLFSLYSVAEKWQIKSLSLGLISYFAFLLKNHEIENIPVILTSCVSKELKKALSHLIDVMKEKKYLSAAGTLLDDYQFSEFLELPIVQTVIYEDLLPRIPTNEMKLSTEYLAIEIAKVPQNLLYSNNQLITYQDENIICFNSQIGKELRSIKTKEIIRSLAFNQKLFAIGQTQEKITIFDINGELQSTLCPKSSHASISCLEFINNDQPFIASGTIKGTLRIHNWMESNRLIEKHIQSKANILSLAFDSDKLYIGTTKELLELDLVKEKIEYFNLEKFALSAPVYSIQDEDNTIITSFGKEIGIIDKRNKSCVNKMVGHDSTIVSIINDKQNQNVFSSSKDNTVRIWDIRHNLCINAFAAQPKVMTYDRINRKLFTVNNNKVFARTLNGLKPCRLLLEDRAQTTKETTIDRSEISYLKTN